MRIGRRSRSARRKPVPVPIGQPQIPHDLTWDRTPATAEVSRILTVRAMAWSSLSIYQSMSVQLFVGSLAFFSFLILYTVGRTP
jgi:hypothetical protein